MSFPATYLLQAEVAAEAANGHSAPRAARLPEDRPSIAVLPFRKEAGDPQEAYFADGIIEGIVHVLSGLERITVVSRGSSLAVAETTVDPREVGQRIGVRYVLYGGVRRAGERLRITTELSETETGSIIRSDRYDGDASDLFALQDRISEQVVATIAPQVRERELARALRKPPANLTGYDLVLRALDRLHRLDRDSFAAAHDLLQQASTAEPGYAPARTYLAWWYTLRIAQGWSEDREADADAIDRISAAAIELDSNDALALALRANAMGYAKRAFATAETMLDHAVTLCPSCALAWSFGAALRCYLGRGTEAVAWATRAVRLAPDEPFTFFHEHILGQAYDTAGDHAAALAWSERAAARNPHHSPTWRTLCAAAVAVGRTEEAGAHAAQVLRLEPGFTLRGWAGRTPLRSPWRESFMTRLRAAGLPD